MYRFNHHYVGTDVYEFTFDIRVDVWFLDELHWVHCGIHYKTDARALLLQKSETRTSAVQGTDEITTTPYRRVLQRVSCGKVAYLNISIFKVLNITWI